MNYLYFNLIFCKVYAQFSFEAAMFLNSNKPSIYLSIYLAKLKSYGVADGALNLFESYFSDRLQLTSVNGKFSSSRAVKCGVPQGSILGPLLFLVYINDLPNCLECTTARLFADDTNITASGKSIRELERTLNLDLANVEGWLSANNSV